MADTLEGFPDFFRYAVWQLLNTCGGSIGSGSRTHDEQASLYASKGAWSPTNPGAAAPGTSNHEVGVGSGAADMEGDLDCMHANAAQFGLVFPMSNEPWHVESSDELIAQGLAYFGIEPGQDVGAAEHPARQQQQTEDPLAKAERLMMGQDEFGADLSGEQTGGVQTVTVPGAAVAPEAAAAPTTPFVPQASAGYTPGSGPISPVEVAQHLANAGFRGEDLVRAVAISYGESGWDPGAGGDKDLANATWGPSLGLMQIRSINAEWGHSTWRDGSRLLDPAYNAKAAYAIYVDAGNTFTDWTVFNENMYQGKMDEARAAVAAIGGGVGVTPPAAPDPAGAEQELDDLLAAGTTPGDMLEGFMGGDVVAAPVGPEVDTTLKKETYASA